MKNKKTYYLAVTPDELELPLFVTDNLQEIADKYHVSKKNILSSIAHDRGGGRMGHKYIRIEVEE